MWGSLWLAPIKGCLAYCDACLLLSEKPETVESSVWTEDTATLTKPLHGWSRDPVTDSVIGICTHSQFLLPFLLSTCMLLHVHGPVLLHPQACKSQLVMLEQLLYRTLLSLCS